MMESRLLVTSKSNVISELLIFAIINSLKMKHSKGTRLRIIANKALHGFEIGQVVTVYSVNKKDYYCLNEYGANGWLVYESDVESLESGQEAISNVYKKLLVGMTKEFRSSEIGQEILCELRDTLALSLGTTAQEVQENHEALASQMRKENAEG